MRGCALAIRVTTHRFWRVPPGEKKKRKGATGLEWGLSQGDRRLGREHVEVLQRLGT